MAGYNWLAGMSNNAVAAYDSGLLPASKIGRVPAALIEKFCRHVEWHHASKAFNRVKFYDPAEVLQTFGLAGDPEAADPAAVAALAEWTAAKNRGPQVYTNCRVEWIEWSGTLSRPRATERVAEGCTVSVKGQTATVTLPDGSTLTKRLTTRGFRFRPAD